MRTESLTWYEIAERLPDDGTTVLVEIDPTTPHSEPVWLGYLDAEQWREVSGEPITVVRWADVPKGGA
jgi:hypothetical protein